MTIKVKNKTANVFPFGDVIVPDIPFTNKKPNVKGRVFTKEDMLKNYEFGWKEAYKYYFGGFKNPKVVEDKK
jgi:hypothetical protein